MEENKNDLEDFNGYEKAHVLLHYCAVMNACLINNVANENLKKRSNQLIADMKIGPSIFLNKMWEQRILRDKENNYIGDELCLPGTILNYANIITVVLNRVATKKEVLVEIFNIVFELKPIERAYITNNFAINSAKFKINEKKKLIYHLAMVNLKEKIDIIKTNLSWRLYDRGK